MSKNTLGEKVILVSKSQKDGVSRKEIPRKEAEKIIEQNKKWNHQFSIEEIK